MISREAKARPQLFLPPSETPIHLHLPLNQLIQYQKHWQRTLKRQEVHISVRRGAQRRRSIAARMPSAGEGVRFSQLQLELKLSIQKSSLLTFPNLILWLCFSVIFEFPDQRLGLSGIELSSTFEQ